MKTSFPSLNLAQAVMHYAWELSKVDMNTSTATSVKNEEGFRSKLEKTETVLKEIGFYENSAIYPRFLERICTLKEGDIHLLLSYCNKLLAEKNN